MPVGKIDDFSKYPSHLLMANKYSEIIEMKRNHEKVKLHCALQGLDGRYSDPCEQSVNKLGIDPGGTVYSCPWGEHLDESNNPFNLEVC